MSNDQRPAIRILGLIACVLFCTSCATIYYNVWEKLGWEKRDLLRDSVEDVRSDQEDVSEQFQSALERIKEIYGLDGGDLEDQYEALNREYERSEEKAEQLRERIRDVEQIAEDLFREWQRESEMISDANLRSRSQQQLAETQRRFSRLSRAMSESEAGMNPVLTKLRDQVLFLKHNLNAQAIGSISLEVREIEQQVDDLIDDLRVSIRRADEFIKTLPE